MAGKPVLPAGYVASAWNGSTEIVPQAAGRGLDPFVPQPVGQFNIVEYAPRDMNKPIGVAEWRTRFVASLPRVLRSSLPTVAQIEAELAGDSYGGKTEREKKRSGKGGAA